MFGHHNIGFFGIPEEGKEPERIVDLILEAFFDVIGEEGTLVLPTFTYSFPKGKVYDPDHSPGIGGAFTEMVRKKPEVYRSLDPSVSVAAIGADARGITENMPENSYAADGVFGRLLDREAKICNMNRDIGTTIVHYAERDAKVPYRFDKTFHGTIRVDGEERETKNTIWVRYLHEQTKPVFEPMDELAEARELCSKVAIGRGFVKVMTARDQYDLVVDTLPDRPWFLTAAEVTGRPPKLEEFTEELM